MLLEAVSLGYAVPQGDFVARVHSVFRSSVNLQAEGGDGLLTLISSPPVDLPQGMRLGTQQGLDFRDLQPGGHISCRDGILFFQASPVRVDLREARRWRCNLVDLNLNLGDPATALAWERAWVQLSDRQRRAEVEIVAEDLFQSNVDARSGGERRAAPAVRELIRATRHCDPAAYLAAAKLIGLGTGLTPSGDDLLVGYLAGLWCTLRGLRDRRRFLASLGRVVIDHSRGTNDISRTYLLHAARGQVASPLVAAAQAIRNEGEPDQLHQYIETAMHMGHSTGMDSLTGLLLGLAAWDGSVA